jgi:hypothetical protein
MISLQVMGEKGESRFKALVENVYETSKVRFAATGINFHAFLPVGE